MDETAQRNCIFAVAREHGLNIRGLYRNPLTGTWHIDFTHKQVRFTPPRDATEEECVAQFKKCLGVGPTVLAEEIDNLRSHVPDTVVGAMGRLKELGETAFEPLVRSLLDPDGPPSFRSNVACTLARMAVPQTFARLAQMTNDPDAHVRASAESALAEFVRVLAVVGDERAVGWLEKLAADDGGDAGVASAARTGIRDEARRAITLIRSRRRP